MPFDALTRTAPAIETPAAPAADPHALYRERRERAAALLVTVPAEKLNMRDYGGRCGSTACALGWLATLRFDGWDYIGALASPARHHGHDPDEAAAAYFGLRIQDASRMFDNTRDMPEVYGKQIADVTPTDVARALLAMPYVGGV